MKNAAILTIGDEILLGQIVDTNAAFIAQKLNLAGIEVTFKCTVGDREEEIWSVLEYAFKHCDLVLITGGLGPTKDDLTKPLLARWFQTELVQHPQALADLEALLKKRGRAINALTLKQAEHPAKALYIKNEIGTAPGIWFEEGGKICVAMPGVPYEMKQMLTERVIPLLKEKLEIKAILHRFVRTIGVPESNLAMAIEQWESQLPSYIRLAYLPSGGQVKLRLTGKGENEFQLSKELDDQLAALLPLIADYVYATEDIELEVVVAGMMASNGIQLDFQDDASNGLFKNKILQFPEISWKPGLSVSHFPSAFIRILKSKKRDAGFDFSIEARFSVKNAGGEIKEFSKGREMKAFLHEETNRNMLCLVAFDSLRRCILEARPFFHPQSTEF